MLQVALIYGVSRLWGFVLFTVVGHQQLVSPWGTGPFSYLDFLKFWDSGWYEQIAQSGYPSDLPVNDAGQVSENPWAFYPLFPSVAQVISRLTGVDYYPVATTVSLCAGFIAAYVIFRLFVESLEQVGTYRFARTDYAKGDDAARSSFHRRLALWAVAAVSFTPVSPVLQIPYAESTNLIFLAATLYLLMRGNWWLAVAVAVLTCLSRPVGVPLGAAAGIWWLVCCCAIVRAERKSAGLRKSLYIGFYATKEQLVSAVLICGAALLWPIIAWVKTGRMDAYTATETAWRGSELAPFLPWIKQGEKYFGSYAELVLACLIFAAVMVLISKTVRATLSPLLILWCGFYMLYLLLFLNPQSSVFRMLLPLFPLCLPLVALSTSRAYRLLLLGVGAILQFGWIGWLWHWKQLPGGGDYPP